jgi:hypothetical protein
MTTVFIYNYKTNEISQACGEYKNGHVVFDLLEGGELHRYSGSCSGEAHLKNGILITNLMSYDWLGHSKPIRRTYRAFPDFHTAYCWASKRVEIKLKRLKDGRTLEPVTININHPDNVYRGYFHPRNPDLFQGGTLTVYGFMEVTTSFGTKLYPFTRMIDDQTHVDLDIRFMVEVDNYPSKVFIPVSKIGDNGLFVRTMGWSRGVIFLNPKAALTYARHVEGMNIENINKEISILNDRKTQHYQNI